MSITMCVCVGSYGDTTSTLMVSAHMVCVVNEGNHPTLSHESIVTMDCNIELACASPMNIE